MAFNGLGTFARLYSWATDKANAIKIRADRMDAEFDGIATGLSTCITKDGQTTITANLPMGGFKHTGVADATSTSHYAAAGQVQNNAFLYCGASGGTANAQTLTPSPSISAYAAGQKFSFLPVATNTSGTVTVATSSLTARTVKKGIGGAKVALAVGDIVINVPAELFDDGTDYILLNPQTYSHGADIASASTINLDTATGDCVDVTGTTGITAITLSEGRQAVVRFTGALTLTHGASLVLPGAANITTAAGDYAIFRGYASGVVRCISYTYSSIVPAPLASPAFTGNPTAPTQSANDNSTKLATTAYVDASLTTAASQAEQETGSSTTKYVSPGRQQYHPSAAKAWVVFNASGTITASYGVASVTKNSTGNYTINFTTAFSSVNYAAIGTNGYISAGGATSLVWTISSQAVGSCTVLAQVSGGAATDPERSHFTFFGDQ